MKLRLADLDATGRLGARLGRALRPGDFIGLTGDLGAGKTALARAIAAGAGVAPDEVSSPTFALINAYRGTLPLFHADLYRLSSRDELFATGYFDLLEGDGALVVEWVEHVPGAAPKDWLELLLRVAEGDARELEALAHGLRGEALRALVPELPR